MEDISSMNQQETKKVLYKCKICEAPAFYASYGVLTCPSCKVFFKRNAERKQHRFKCFFNNDCEINADNRRICSCCRLAKCFRSGMQISMIRATRKSPEDRKRKRQIKTTTAILLARLKEKNPFEQLPTLNLLQSDQSTLTIEQWNFLSNLTHCFDEYSGFKYTQSFLQEQNELPLKMRCKLSSVEEYFTVITSTGRLLYEKNSDFRSLSPHDHSILLHRTMKYVVGLGTCLILKHTRALENENLYRSAETIYGSNTMSYSIRTINQLDSDGIFVKLILNILAFSTFDYVFYMDSNSINSMNIKSILCIQDMYAELTWRYLLYRYDYKQAVISFSNLIRCLFSLNSTIIAAFDCTQYRTMLDSFIKQTEQTLTPSE